MPPRQRRRRSRGQGSSCSYSPPDQDTDSNHAGGALSLIVSTPFTSPDVRQSWTREHPRLFQKPIVSNFPIVVDVLVAGPVRLLPAFPLFDLRGVLELLFGDVQLEAVGLFIVDQHRPGNRIVILADAEEAAETQDCVGDAAGELVDHQALDLPDALTARVVDRHSLHPVACDQGRSLALLHRCGLLPITMDLLIAVPVRLLPAFRLFDFRGVPELLFGDVHAVSAKRLIVVQHRSGNPILVPADAEKAAETQDRLRDPAAGFIDYKALDLPDALTLRVIDRSSFHSVAC